MKYTNRFDLPQSIFDAIARETYDLDRSRDNVISVSALIDTPKIRQLKLRHWNEIEDDISNTIWMLLGSSIHSVLERAKHEDRLIEQRLYQDIDGFTISGKVDLYEKEEKIIQDYKVTSTYGFTKGEGYKKEWEQQLNCYAWLYRKAGFEVNELKIVAILRDWQRRISLTDTRYPNIPLIVVNVPLWSLEKQEKFIRDRLNNHMLSANLDDGDIPECSEEDRWQDRRCKDYCIVKRFCHHYKKIQKENDLLT